MLTVGVWVIAIIIFAIGIGLDFKFSVIEQKLVSILEELQESNKLTRERDDE